MQRYHEFQPSAFDSRSNFMAFDAEALDSIEDWLVLPCSRNRDSDVLSESNFACALESLGGEGKDVQVHRFGHWACGWYEIIVVRPDTKAAEHAEEIEAALSDYPILDESDYSERETEEAQRVWENCYTTKGRIEYIRENRSQFDFHDWRDLMGCVRGKWFNGYASELLG